MTGSHSEGAGPNNRTRELEDRVDRLSARLLFAEKRLDEVERRLTGRTPGKDPLVARIDELEHLVLKLRRCVKDRFGVP